MEEASGGIEKRRWLYFYVSVVAICVMSCYAGLADFDYYWQIRLGEKIVRTGNFNGMLDLVWGDKGLGAYIDHEWLSNVIFYLFSLFGDYGVFILKFCIVFSIGLALIQLMRSLGVKELTLPSYTSILFLLFLMSTILFKVKAYTFSIVLVIWEIMILESYTRDNIRWNWRCFGEMVLLTVLWTNIHSGSMPLMFVIAGVYWVTKIRNSASIVAGLICICSTVINPWGYKLLLFNLEHNFNGVMKQIVMDWRPIDAKELYGKAAFLIIMIIVIHFCNARLRDNLFEVISICLMLYLSLESARHLGYLLPFGIMLILKNQYQFRLKMSVVEYTTLFTVGLACLICFKTVTSEDYRSVYMMHYADEELEDLLVETNSEDNEGLMDTAIDLWSLGLRTFVSGAFPATEQRSLDEYMMLYSGSPEQIGLIIEYYGLTKFVFPKVSNTVFYYIVENTLYEYLSCNADYICLYDSDYYVYFVHTSVLE